MKINKLQVFIAKCESNENDLKELLNKFVIELQNNYRERLNHSGSEYTKRVEEAVKKTVLAKDKLIVFVDGELINLESKTTKTKPTKNDLVDLENFLKFIVEEKLNMNWNELKEEFKNRG